MLVCRPLVFQEYINYEMLLMFLNILFLLSSYCATGAFVLIEDGVPKRITALIRTHSCANVLEIKRT